MQRRTRRWQAMAILLALAFGQGACSTPESAEHQGSGTEASARADHDHDGESADHEHGDEAEGDEEEAPAHPGHQQKRFEDPEQRAEEWNSPERDDWQRPGAIVEAMGIEPGMTVADVGAGTGYFIPHLAEAVGEAGRVLAVDIEPAMLEYIEERADEWNVDNVETVRAEKTATNLEESSVDRILIVNTWHHIPDRGNYARHLRERLTEGGSVWIVDFTQNAPTGPPKKHRLDPEVVIEELERGGLEAELHELELDRQYVVVGRVD